MIVTHLDKNYLLWGKLLLMSASINAPNEEVYISAANLTPEEIVWLHHYHKRLTVQNHHIEVPETIEYRRYMQCRITQVLLEVYDRYCLQNETIIAMNADMLIRKPMDELNETMLLLHGGQICTDVLFKFDAEHLSMKEILNEVIVFCSDNKAVLPFLQHYNSMWDDGKIVHRDDQRQLYKSFIEFKGGLHFGNLPIDYTDKFMQRDSHIWSAHVHNRFVNYNRFCTELKLSTLDVCPYPEAWGVSI